MHTAATSSVIPRHLARVAELIDQLDHREMSQIAATIERASQTGRCVFICGNGGSAATAEHFATDLTHAVGVKAMCLSSNVSQLSATGNDLGYERIFERQLEHWMQPDDVVIALSVSGTSDNCVRALRFAQNHGAIAVGLLGEATDGCGDHSTYAVHVGSSDHRSVETVHMAIAHAITDELASLHGGKVDVATATTTS